MSFAARDTAALGLQSTVLGGIPGEPAGNDLFGYAVAIDADTLVVGAYSDEVVLQVGQGESSNVGSVYVFHFTGQAWQLEQRLIAPDAQAGAFFGWDVAISGDTLVAGARQQDSPPPGGGANVMDQGAAYVFRRIAGSWVLEQILGPGQALGAGAGLGWAVAIDGNTAAIGAPDAGEGVADVYARTGNTWQFQQRLSRPPAQGFAGPNAFGRALAIDAGSILVGAPLEDNPPFTHADAGAAYVYTQVASTWILQARLVPGQPVAGAGFAAAVALEGNRALIGSPDEAVLALSSAGAVHDFTRGNGGAWLAPVRIVSPAPADSARFGASISIEMPQVVIGAYWASGNGTQQEGRVHLFADSGSGMASVQTLSAPPSTRAAFNQFGNDVAIAAGRVVAGEPGYDNLLFNDGAAHVFAPDAGAIFANGFEP